jgi:hypothetical protein
MAPALTVATAASMIGAFFITEIKPLLAVVEEQHPMTVTSWHRRGVVVFSTTASSPDVAVLAGAHHRILHAMSSFSEGKASVRPSFPAS